VKRFLERQVDDLKQDKQDMQKKIDENAKWKEQLSEKKVDIKLYKV
jgi:prefoldin subunit 5